MKTIRFNAKTKKIFLGFLTVMLMIPFSLQAQKIPFLKSSVTPAAEGYVKINSDRNNNNVTKLSKRYNCYLLNLSLKHLLKNTVL